MSDELDLGSLTTPEGYYLVREAPTESFEPAIGSDDEDGAYAHRFTYRGSVPSIKRTAIDLVRGARRKIFLASFRIGDRDLLEALFAAVDRLHGGVYVVTSWTEQSLRRDLANLEDMADVDVQAQQKRFDELTQRGIALRGHEECHAKFLVVDDERALVSSANLETSALTDIPRRRATGESGVVLTDAGEVVRLARFFTRLWYSGCTWETTPGAEYALRKRTPTASPVTVAPLANGRPGVIWTHGNGTSSERGILTAMHDVIGRARSELLLATFSLVGIRERPELLLDPLRRAISEHELEVKLLVRARNNKAAHRDGTAALAELGVAIYGDTYTHAKGLIADGRYGALFSANFDAEHGLFDGVEVGVRLDGRPVLREAYRYLQHAMTHADLGFVPRPTQRELDRGLGARWRRRWRYGERLAAVATNADWRSLVAAATEGPVLWEDAGELRLYVADLAATLRPAGRARYRLVTERVMTEATGRLQGWFDERPAGGSPTPKRGLCPAVLTLEEEPGSGR